MALLRFSATVSFYTLLSRVFGFARDILIARYLGTTGAVEAWVVAFRFPNFFRRLVAEGAFTAAFVPLFSRRLETKGRGPALRFAEENAAVLVGILVLFTLAAEAFMPWIVAVIAPGFHNKPEIFDLTVLFGRIMVPYLLCMAVVALLSGVLNSFRKFAAAAAAPLLLNVILVLGLVLTRERFETPGHLLSWGVALAGVGQVVWMVWAGRRAGFVLRIRRPRLTKGVRELLKLMAPGAVGAGVTQINLLVGTMIATLLPGAVSFLYFADRVYQFPLGIIGIAIGTALLPELSRKLRQDKAAAMEVQNRAVEIAMLFTLPAAAALFVMPAAIITVMFQYGKFDAADAGATAAALAAFATGLPAYVLIKVLAPGFFAREDTVTPVRFAIVSVVINIVLSITLIWWIGHVGIAVATSVAAWVNAALLARVLIRRGYWKIDAGLRRRLPRILVASLVMALALLPALAMLEEALGGSLGARIAAMAALVAGGAVVFAATALLIDAARPAELRRLLRRETG